MSKTDDLREALPFFGYEKIKDLPKREVWEHPKTRMKLYLGRNASMRYGTKVVGSVAVRDHIKEGLIQASKNGNPLYEGRPLIAFMDEGVNSITNRYA